MMDVHSSHWLPMHAGKRHAEEPRAGNSRRKCCSNAGSEKFRFHIEGIISGDATFSGGAAVSPCFTHKLNGGNCGSYHRGCKQRHADVLDSLRFQPSDDLTAIEVRQHRFGAEPY